MMNVCSKLTYLRSVLWKCWEARGVRVHV